MTSAQAAPRPRRSTRRFRAAQKAAPFVFLAPAILLLALFLLYPLVSSFRLSFVDWNGLGDGAVFVGFRN